VIAVDRIERWFGAVNDCCAWETHVVGAVAWAEDLVARLHIGRAVFADLLYGSCDITAFAPRQLLSLGHPVEDSTGRVGPTQDATDTACTSSMMEIGYSILVAGLVVAGIRAHSG
jgi:hypothetical protein